MTLCRALKGRSKGITAPLAGQEVRNEPGASTGGVPLVWRIGRRENRILWLRTSRTVAVMTGECSHTYGLSRLNLRLFQRGAHRPTSESGIVFKTGETTKEKFVDLPPHARPRSFHDRHR